jgi:dCMP deaminase
MINKKTFMKIADTIAQESKAKRYKVGSVIVKNDRIISCGYNGTPPGFSNECEDENGNTKATVIHSEVNAIFAASKVGIEINDSSMYCNLSPCVPCALAICSVGIRNFYYRDAYRDSSGLQLLLDAGINVEKVE